jgi:pyruvate,water dikinase
LELNVMQYAECGGKAAQLARLAAAGFSVPSGFCVTSGAYREHLRRSRVAAGYDEGSFEVAQRLLRSAELDPLLVEEIGDNYRRLTALQPSPVAVRSSSTAEDLAEHSFAGLYDTVLDVNGEAELLEAIRHCWASYWSREAVVYRDQAGMDHDEHAMAIVVQAMVQPRFGGVLFTRAPTQAGENAAVVEYVPGNAEAVVSGEVRAGRYVIERSSRRLLSQHCLGSGLEPGLLDRLLELGLEIEERLGAPQDIEWCVDDAENIWFVLYTRL